LAIHVTQMVSFGLDVIRALQFLNIELDESLRIGAGANTEEAIVTGILGLIRQLSIFWNRQFVSGQ